MTRILIVDDHPIVRKGLKETILKIPNSIVDEASNASETMLKLKCNLYDLVLLDISLPDKSGIELLEDLKKKYTKVKVIMVSIYNDEEYAIRCFKLGAEGYISKNDEIDELNLAIRKVLSGGKFISSTISEELPSYFESDKENLPHKKLSNREFQVFLSIASGNSMKETANKLCLSEKTVSTYRTRILEKMNLKNNAEIIYYAIRNKLVKIDNSL